MFTGWFIRLVGVLAVLGVIGFDGFSIVAAHLSASDDAQNVAQASANAYKLRSEHARRAHRRRTSAAQGRHPRAQLPDASTPTARSP